ncbi:hypothetical protein GE09DRAFT_1281133 [Coniochaeta sp. 2T2.1]|nr:hypothetical protein GE09DRAFT_1281133 [Coniochaeta sp. 2T2.1]
MRYRSVAGSGHICAHQDGRHDNSRSLAELDAPRREGWQSNEAESHFATQREVADNPDDEAKMGFFNMARRVAQELNKVTKVMDISRQRVRQTTPVEDAPAILDLCMAPGGFSTIAVEANPTAGLSALTLSPEPGGHAVTLRPEDYSNDVVIEPADVTLLAAERAQLVVAVARVRRGGTLVVLLHHLETWNTCQVMYVLNQFSRVRLFKPRAAHATRSSFYLVAEDVESESPKAKAAVQRWKALWRRLTLDRESVEIGTGGDVDDADGMNMISGENVDDVLGKFGRRRLHLSLHIWQAHARALRKAPWNKRAAGDGERGGAAAGGRERLSSREELGIRKTNVFTGMYWPRSQDDRWPTCC